MRDPVEGIKKLQKEIKNIYKMNVKAVTIDCEADAKLIITKVVYNTPESPNYKRTGRLRVNITHEFIEKDGSIVGRVGTDVEYAPYVEFGTKRRTGRPYLFPAFKINAPKLSDYIAKDILKLSQRKHI